MNALRLLTIMLAALSMAMAFSHLLQLPARMRFDGPTWITTQQLFPLYGSIGSAIEIVAVLLAGLLAYLVRQEPGFGWALVGAICLLLALAVWLGFVAPANARISQWTAETIGGDWTRWRTQWEYAHAARAVLLIAGLACLVQSVMVEARAAG